MAPITLPNYFAMADLSEDWKDITSAEDRPERKSDVEPLDGDWEEVQPDPEVGYVDEGSQFCETLCEAILGHGHFAYASSYGVLTPRGEDSAFHILVGPSFGDERVGHLLNPPHWDRVIVIQGAEALKGVSCKAVVEMTISELGLRVHKVTYDPSPEPPGYWQKTIKGSFRVLWERVNVPTSWERLNADTGSF